MKSCGRCCGGDTGHRWKLRRRLLRDVRRRDPTSATRCGGRSRPGQNGRGVADGLVGEWLPPGSSDCSAFTVVNSSEVLGLPMCRCEVIVDAVESAAVHKSGGDLVAGTAARVWHLREGHIQELEPGQRGASAQSGDRAHHLAVSQVLLSCNVCSTSALAVGRGGIHPGHHATSATPSSGEARPPATTSTPRTTAQPSSSTP